MLRQLWNLSCLLAVLDLVFSFTWVLLLLLRDKCLVIQRCSSSWDRGIVQILSLFTLCRNLLTSSYEPKAFVTSMTIFLNSCKWWLMDSFWLNSWVNLVSMTIYSTFIKQRYSINLLLNSNTIEITFNFLNLFPFLIWFCDKSFFFFFIRRINRQRHRGCLFLINL